MCIQVDGQRNYDNLAILVSFEVAGCQVIAFHELQPSQSILPLNSPESRTFLGFFGQ